MNDIRFEYYWKNELINTANYILKLYSSKVNNKKLFTLERKIMACLLHIRQNDKKYFYRKGRLYPDEIYLVQYPINVDYNTSAINTTKQKPKSIIKEIFSRYKMAEGKKEKVKIKKICDFFVHQEINSYFIPVFNRLYGTYIATDYTKKEYLTYINMTVFAQIFLSLANNRMVGIEPIFNKEGGIYKINYTDKW